MRRRHKRIQEKINHHRVFHIITSYQLASDDSGFRSALDNLLIQHPSALIELAIVDVLVQSWAVVPLVRGLAFLDLVILRLQDWNSGVITSKVTPDLFESITGLTAQVVFGSAFAMKSQFCQETNPT
jgi:hypothetical protein